MRATVSGSCAPSLISLMISVDVKHHVYLLKDPPLVLLLLLLRPAMWRRLDTSTSQTLSTSTLRRKPMEVMGVNNIVTGRNDMILISSVSPLCATGHCRMNYSGSETRI